LEIYLRLLTIDDDDKTIVARVAKFLGCSVRAVYRSLTKAREAARR
jgi:predicted transcriptional regulator YheO